MTILFRQTEVEHSESWKDLSQAPGSWGTLSGCGRLLCPRPTRGRQGHEAPLRGPGAPSPRLSSPPAWPPASFSHNRASPDEEEDDTPPSQTDATNRHAD